MIKVFGVFLLAGACFGPVYGQTQKQAASADAETVKQLEREWLDAEKAGDTVKIGSILADDWVGLQSDGSSETKQQAIDGIKSGADKMLSADLGPMSVKLIGPVAIVQGSDVEKSSSKGKDTSGKWVWMDVFVKRDGRWQVVRSQVARLP